MLNACSCSCLRDYDLLLLCHPKSNTQTSNAHTHTTSHSSFFERVSGSVCVFVHFQLSNVAMYYNLIYFYRGFYDEYLCVCVLCYGRPTHIVGNENWEYLLQSLRVQMDFWLKRQFLNRRKRMIYSVSPFRKVSKCKKRRRKGRKKHAQLAKLYHLHT